MSRDTGIFDCEAALEAIAEAGGIGIQFVFCALVGRTESRDVADCDGKPVSIFGDYYFESRTTGWFNYELQSIERKFATDDTKLFPTSGKAMPTVKGGAAKLKAAIKKLEKSIADLSHPELSHWTETDQEGITSVLTSLKRFQSATQAAIHQRSHTSSNRVAELLATDVYLAFEMAGKPPTYYNGNDGSPETPFGRAVETALLAFNIRHGWREPTKRAVEKSDT